MDFNLEIPLNISSVGTGDMHVHVHVWTTEDTENLEIAKGMCIGGRDQKFEVSFGVA